MIKKLYILTFVLLFPFFGSVLGQDTLVVTGNGKENRLITKANENYEQYSFSPAIDIYKKVLDKGFISADLLKRLGNSYYFNADYKEAAATYKRLITVYAIETGPDYYFRYAQTLKTLGNYKGAETIMAKFAELTKDDNRAEAYEDEKDFLEEIKNNSGRYEIGPFEYNSSYSDFAPAFYKEGLIFSSDRDTGNFAKNRHTWTATDFLDLYKVNADSISESKVVKIEEGINTRLHESTSVTTKDGKTLYFTRNNIVEGKAKRDTVGVIRLKIYKATMSNGIWGDIEELPFNKDTHSAAHPALSADEKTLYFASDMKGSLGASDIFMVAINDDGSYGDPVNLGGNINTEARETFPFVTKEDVLYFSSDGHPGLGGLDVFATKIDNKKFDGSIENVGEPINGMIDDFTFIIDEEGEGYFASNRPEGKGGDDIYSFVEIKPLLLDCEQEITGTVRDKISNEILVGATVKVINEQNDEMVSTITDSEGHYSLMLDCSDGNFVRASMQGYVTTEDYLARSDGKPKIIDFYLDRDTVTAGFGDDLAKLLQLSTIYFDFNRYNIRKDSEVEVEKVIAAMEKYPSLRIRVNSHTDSRGKDAYNLWLSQKRAESTVNYMISKGISKSRVDSEGYGETKLINGCSNGIPCSDAEHELNRRSEFIILQ